MEFHHKLSTSLFEQDFDSHLQASRTKCCT